MSDLKPCPFCGSDKITIEWEHCDPQCRDDTNRRWFAECTQCSCQGPFCQKEPEVAARWNNQSRLTAAEQFKTFVHSYMDQHGVPHGDPENQHQKEGCRIGARLDLMFAQITAAEKERDEAQARVKQLETINKRACDDWSHDDTKVKELLKPHLPGDDLESDGYGFRGVIAVAELAAARLTALENALREAKEALKQLNGLTTDAIDAKRKALQTLSALNIK